MLKEVNKTVSKSEIRQLKRELKKINKQYADAKYRFKHSVDCNEFQILTADEFLKLKELCIKSQKLYWKIYLLENPEKTATVEAYTFLNRLGDEKSIDWLSSKGLTTHDLIREIEANPDYLKEEGVSV